MARKKADDKADYDKAVAQLAKVIARWIETDGKASLDDHLTQVADDLEQLIAQELNR